MRPPGGVRMGKFTRWDRMSPNERARMLRLRYRALGGFPYQTRGRNRPWKDVARGPCTKRSLEQLHFGITTSWRIPKWVTVTQRIHKSELAVSRDQPTTMALIRIAEQLPTLFMRTLKEIASMPAIF